MLDLDKLFEQFPRLKLVDELAARHRFHHWELIFADLFYGARADGTVRGGFDLVLGNPPWIRVEWQEGGVLSDFDPALVVRKHSAADLTELRGAAFEQRAGLRAVWLAEQIEASATQRFLNAVQNYPLLKGQQTNLFKCFSAAGMDAAQRRRRGRIPAAGGGLRRSEGQVRYGKRCTRASVRTSSFRTRRSCLLRFTTKPFLA